MGCPDRVIIMKDDFIDFMTSGGDDLINGKECQHCHKWVKAEDADEVDAKCPT